LKDSLYCEYYFGYKLKLEKSGLKPAKI